MPKFVENDENILNIKATKEFTDREEPRKVFWEKYNQMLNDINNEKSPIQVISYYGFGGIGKSALLHKLNEELKEQANNSKVEFIDFEKLADLNNNILDILKVIRQDLKSKYKFSFAIFDLVVYVYETKMGKTATKPELNSIFNENKELGFLKDVLGEIPLIGTFTKVIYYADAGRNMLKDRLKNIKLRQRLLDIENSSLEDIKEHLPYYFAMDLKENLKNETAPFVFFIDTYEKLVNELTHIGDALKNDLWLRSDEGLICRIPHTLWVIAGREKLKWEGLDSSWKGTLEQHLLGTLSFQDTMQFLKTAGIENEDLIHQIYDLTHGAPMYLDMCIDTYIKLAEKNKKATIEDFGGDTTKLVKRFLMYMNDTERDFSTMLAYIPEWTDDTIENISIKMNGSFSFSLYEKVKNFSFIVNENGKYRMHESVKDIIIANTPDMIKRKYQKILKEDTNIMLNEAIQTNRERINEMLKTLPENEISFFDNYEAKYAYTQVIQKLYTEILQEKDENTFNDKVQFLLEKLEKYEDEFNEPIYLDNLYFLPFQDSKYNILLKTYDRLSNLDDAYKNYEKLKIICGKYSEEPLLSIKHYLRWNYLNFKTEKLDSFLNAIESTIGKANLYYISMYGVCADSIKDAKQEFINNLKEYTGRKDKFFVKLVLDASKQSFISSYYFEKISKDVDPMSFYNFYENYTIYEKEITKEAKPIFLLAINTLKENPKLLDFYTLKKLYNTYSSFYFSKVNPLSDLMFEYVYSVRYIALNTSNQEVIDYFLNIFKEFLGGEENKKEAIVTNKETLSKILNFLKQLKLHYEELYGKDHYNVNEMEDYINKFEKLTPDKLDKILKNKIERYGIQDDKTQRTFMTYIVEVKNKDLDNEEAKEFFDIILNYSIKIISSYKREEILENSDLQNKFYDLIFDIKEILLEIYKKEHNDYSFRIDYQEYYNEILNLDKIIYKFYDDKKGKCGDLVFEDAESVFYILYNIKDTNLINKAFYFVKEVLEKQYSNSCLLNLITIYSLYKTYNFINGKEIYRWDYDKIRDSYFNKIDTLEQVINYHLSKSFSYGYKNEHFSKLLDILLKESNDTLDNFNIQDLTHFINAIEDMEKLEKLYIEEYGKKSSKAILLRAYIGLLETLILLKKGTNDIDQAITVANPNDEVLLVQLEEIKKLVSRYIEIQKNIYKFNNIQLFDYTLIDIKNMLNNSKNCS